MLGVDPEGRAAMTGCSAIWDWVNVFGILSRVNPHWNQRTRPYRAL